MRTLANGMAVSVGRVRACPGAHAQVRRARSQHDSRRGWCIGSQRGADAQTQGQLVIICKFGGTSVADRAAMSGSSRSFARRGRRRSSRRAATGADRSSWCPRSGGATDRLLGLAAEAGAGDIDGAIEHVRALRARHLEVAGVISNATERAGVEAFIDAEFVGLERIVGALGVLREVIAALARRDCGHRRDPQQPHRRGRADVARPGGLLGRCAQGHRHEPREHTAAAPLWPETTRRAAEDRRSRSSSRGAFRSSADSSAPRRMASRRRSGAADRITRRRSSARASARRRFRSGPTWTAC